MMIKPHPITRSGLVRKLKLNIVPGQAEVFVHQTQSTRQKQNPNWQIEVTKIDGRHDEATRALIRSACEETARIFELCASVFTKPDLLRKFRSAFRIFRGDHGIVSWQAPSRSILFRCKIIMRANITLQHF